MFQTTSNVRLRGSQPDERRRLLDLEVHAARTVDSYAERGIKVETDFVCPLTREFMKEPVIAECGHSFERWAIRKHIDTLLAQSKVPYSPVTLAPYGSHKTPSNQGLLRSIEHWHRNIEKNNDPGPASSWLAYVAPRKDVAYSQPVVLPDGNTVDHDQVYSWIIGSELSPFSPKYKFKEWELVVPDYNLRSLMQKHGLGSTLETPPVPAQKVHIHSGASISAWNTKNQLTWGCGPAILSTLCSFAALIPVVMFCGSSLPAAAPAMAAVGAAAQCPPALGVFCWKTYAQEKAFLEQKKERVERRWRHSVAVPTALTQDISFKPGTAVRVASGTPPPDINAFEVMSSARSTNREPSEAQSLSLTPGEFRVLVNEAAARIDVRSADSLTSTPPAQQDLHRDA